MGSVVELLDVVDALIADRIENLNPDMTVTPYDAYMGAVCSIRDDIEPNAAVSTHLFSMAVLTLIYFAEKHNERDGQTLTSDDLSWRALIGEEIDKRFPIVKRQRDEYWEETWSQRQPDIIPSETLLANKSFLKSSFFLNNARMNEGDRESQIIDFLDALIGVSDEYRQAAIALVESFQDGKPQPPVFDPGDDYII